MGVVDRAVIAACVFGYIGAKVGADIKPRKHLRLVNGDLMIAVVINDGVKRWGRACWGDTNGGPE